MSAVYEARGLTIAHRLAPCDLALEGGSVTMIVGPNGAGKTSLLHAMAGIEGEAAARLIEGSDLETMAPAQRRRALAYLGASRDAKWPLLARDFVALGIEGRDTGTRVESVLAELEAEHLADRRIDSLSTGERSRIMIARALAPQAPLILLDEPCANLDPKWQLVILDRLRREAGRGAAIALSIHDLDLARRHGDRVIVIERGNIRADSDPQTALSDANVTRYFGVRREDGRWAIA